MEMNKIIAFLLLTLISFHLSAQPRPGDVFREYIWLPDLAVEEGGKFLRVGGRLDYKTNNDHFPADRHDDGHVLFGQYLKLNHATKAELVVEKLGSHEDTKNLRVSINRNSTIRIPNAKEIPEPESDYMHHTYPVANILLDQLNEGWENTFRFDVDTAQRWNWPQNIIYGLILRIYYNPEIADFKTNINGIDHGSALDEKQIIGLDDPNLNIKQVEYIGFYDGLNYEGDGIYKQWHYHYLRGRVIHHIGTAYMYPYQTTWDTSWIPDQDEIKVSARIVSNSGLIYFTKPVENLKLKRNYIVELCKPFDQPKNWVTREDEFESKIELRIDPSRIEEARIYWTSWSPCYANGIYINDIKVFDNEGPCYEYMSHDIKIEDVSVINQGINIIKTGKEPLHDGQMVHGMEVQWPGIMMKVKYSEAIR